MIKSAIDSIKKYLFRGNMYYLIYRHLNVITTILFILSMGKFKKALNDIRTGFEFWDEDNYKSFFKSLGINEESIAKLGFFLFKIGSIINFYRKKQFADKFYGRSS